MPDIQMLGIPDHPVDEIEMMRLYYQKFFPFRAFFQWLNHSPVPSNDFANRELAYTLEDDTYVRYKSFPTVDEFKKDLLYVTPKRFEVGAIYRINPRDRKSVRKDLVKPIAKELVFDIDLTDYDNIRTCCDEARICIKCWQFITVSIKVLDTALRDDFGFNHILWVYSGRRGAHAWVCDKRARDLTDHQRSAITSYLQVLGRSTGGKAVDLRRPLHPHLSRSLDILKHDFPKMILRDQDPWAGELAAEKLAHKLPDSTLSKKLVSKWKDSIESSRDKWLDIDTVAQQSGSTTLDPTKLMEAKQDIIFEYTYPRLDVAVSKLTAHLLKSPFCVHPKTGRVCVPIDVDNVESFNPFLVPTVDHLLSELNSFDIDKPTDDRLESYEKTSLKPYVETFRKFVNNLVKEEQETSKRRRDDSLDF